MIKPTIGRVVLVHRNSPFPAVKQPEAAFVAYVHSDTMINVGGFDHNGVPFAATSVPLLQDDAVPGSATTWAEWMPYQKAQAAKAE